MELDQSLQLIKALSDSSRLLLLNALLERPHYVEELAERLDLAASTVSFHLKKLQQAGWVSREKQQYYVMFYANPQLLNKTLRELIAVDDISQQAQQQRMEKYKNKVLKNFFEDGVLKKLPAQHKKRWIVLQHMVQLFASDKRYQEKEVNQIITPVFEDYCLIRRLLVDLELMHRQDGYYWRVAEEKAEVKTGPEVSSQATAGTQGQADELEENTVQTGNTEMEKQRRQELKKAYKESLRPMGIYRIVNLQNGKMLLDSSYNLPGAINGHKALLSMFKKHPIAALQRDWDRYGEAAFAFEIVDTLERKHGPDSDYSEDLGQLEELWRSKYQLTKESEYHL